MLGLIAGPAFAQRVQLNPQSATGSFNDLSDPNNVEIAVGNSLLIYIQLDGTVTPFVDVSALDTQPAITPSGMGLNCDDITIDEARGDLAVSDCTLCSATCGPPAAAGMLSTAGPQTDDFLAYVAEMTVTCKMAGSFSLGFSGSASNTVIGSTPQVNIVDDPGEFETINIDCVIPQGQCCDGVDCVDASGTPQNGTNTTTGEAECQGVGGTWTFGLDCTSPCLCATNADCQDNDACTDNICNAGTGVCSFPATTAATNCAAMSEPPCITFACNSGSGACEDLSANNDGNACDDENPCTDGDVCNGGACDSGLLILGKACTVDSDCDNVAEGIAAPAGACLPDNTCDCSVNPTLCLQTSGSTNGSGQICHDEGDTVTVDVQVGPALEAICGFQGCMAWDPCLTLTSVAADPDGETGMSQKLIEVIDNGAGSLVYASALPIGTACDTNGVDPTNGTLTGGTVARLEFASACNCKSPGVWFYDCNPPTRLAGADGAIEPKGCEGDSDPSPTGDLFFQPDLSISCPGGSTGNADCGGGNTRHVCLDAVELSGTKCGNVDGPNCDCKFYPACEDDLDCGNGAGDLCDMGTNTGCGAFDCIPDATAQEFGFDGFCATGTCSGGFCTDFNACAFDAGELAAGGCFDFGPGRTEVTCDASNDCGDSDSCGFNITNTGQNTLCVDLELSPKMDVGNKNDAITRCVKLDLSNCSTFYCNYGDPTAGICQPGNPLYCGGDIEQCQVNTISYEEEVVFGAPDHIAGHGSMCVKVPPQNWDCLVATAEGKSLPATCHVDCDASGDYVASFKGSSAQDTCHWLVQGNLDGDAHIDVADFTILAGQYPSTVGSQKSCGDGPNADFNGDGLVTLADYTFIVVNFFAEEKNPCAVECNPAAAVADLPAPRTSISVAELVDMGLGQYVRSADLDRNGVVDINDMSRFLQKNASDDPQLARDLLDQIAQFGRNVGAGVR
jgi:hypothetical protein